MPARRLKPAVRAAKEPMSRLIATILLAILMFPLAALVYLLTFFISAVGLRNSVGSESNGLVVADLITWGFITAYWFALWARKVNWTPARKTWTGVSFLAAGGAGMTVGFIAVSMLPNFDSEFGVFIGGVTAPLLWVVATIFIWRESAGESAARLANTEGGVVCPTCGYNLTGLKGTRCPECGNEFTLDQLLASQPSRAVVELES
jgi:hypothetical protein